MAIIINGQNLEDEEKSNIVSQPIIDNQSFYYSDFLSKDINKIMSYQLDIEIEKYFSQVLNFPLNRIIYSSNEYCFRERTRKNNGELNIPFMNYYNTGYSDVDRLWFNQYANIKYPMLYSEELVKILGDTFRITPIKLEYEGTVFFSQHEDCKYAYKELEFEKSNETRIMYSLPVKNELNEINNINNIGVMNFDLDFNSTYNENDWLEQNKIYTIGLNFSVDTFIIKSNNKVPFIANKVLLDFIVAKNGVDLKNISDEGIISEIIEYFEGV